jgi:acyl-CoA synthetase (AMP-forming)/AMP-acid ligase II
MPPSGLNPPPSSLAPRVNVADRLADIAARMPDAVAVAHPGRGDVAGTNSYATCTFRELDDDATALARRLVDLGVRPGHRLVLLVPPTVAFVKLVFALLRSGATTVLVDPGMGRKHLVNCLAATEPDGFVAVSRAQAVRTVLRRRFPTARFNVTVGRRWFWGGATFRRLLERGRQSAATLPATHADDLAAIIFTSGSTGPPKGVLYAHRMFDAQVAAIQQQYDLQPGGADLACFALFGLFNSAMGVTTVFPPRLGRAAQAAGRGKRLAGDAGVCVAGGLGPAQPPLRANRRASSHTSQSFLVRRAGAGRSRAAHAHERRGEWRRDAHAIRRDRSVARVDDRRP